MAELIARLRGRLRSEAGFSLIELVVAAALAAVALTAMIGTFDGSRDAISGAERLNTATHVGEQELERIAAMDYHDIGLTSAPTTALDPYHPCYYVLSSGQYQWDRRDSTRIENLVTGQGTLAVSSSWTDGTNRLSGQVWRFITWVYDPNLVQSPDQPEAKRVTVAVTVSGGKRKFTPVTLSSIVYDKKGA